MKNPAILIKSIFFSKRLCLVNIMKNNGSKGKAQNFEKSNSSLQACK